MARPLRICYPENATIEALKQVSRVGSIETATRCTAIQMLLAAANQDLLCNALLVTNRALRKWINRFNHCGVDGLIVKKRPATMAIIKDSKEYQIQCSYEAAVRFFTNKAMSEKMKNTYQSVWTKPS